MSYDRTYKYSCSSYSLKFKTKMPSHSVAAALKAFAHDELYEKEGSYDVIIRFHSATVRQILKMNKFI